MGLHSAAGLKAVVVGWYNGGTIGDGTFCTWYNQGLAYLMWPLCNYIPGLQSSGGGAATSRRCVSSRRGWGGGTARPLLKQALAL